MDEIIRMRKSIRRYKPESLSGEALAAVKTRIDQVKPLFPAIRHCIVVADKAGGLYGVKAPHYLIFSSEIREGAFENIGFIGQQMDLFLSETGLGACWLGGAKPAGREARPLPFVICMAFGKPEEPLHRTLSEFKRKDLSQISEGEDARLEAARLAPSAMNAQNWFFTAQEGKIRCYRKKANPLVGLIYDKLHSIDMGIALCHIARESNGFSFVKEPDAPLRKGFVYTGTVTDAP